MKGFSRMKTPAAHPRRKRFRPLQCSRSPWGWLLLLGLGALGCSTTPPPRGLVVVEPTAPPPSIEEVEGAQRHLAERGLYHGPIDGELDAETRVAIARFQRKSGFEVTGTLDPVTQEALASGPLPQPAPEQQALPPELELPSASALLEEPLPLPQPPPGALDATYEEVRRGFLAAAAEAERLLAGTTQEQESPQGQVPQQEQAPPRGQGSPRGQEPSQEQEPAQEPPQGQRLAERLAAAQQVIAQARIDAFRLLVEARREGGWALLPEALEVELRKALSARHLLLRPEDEGWGRDEAAAVRWLGRSLGIPDEGLPSLQLLEALGIDPAPMFGPVGELNARRP